MKPQANPFDPIYNELAQVNEKLDKLLNPPEEDYSRKYYTVNEASKILRCVRATIINRINRGAIIPKNGVKPYLIPHYQIFDSDNQKIQFGYKTRKA
jgi:hypothetical protein